MITYKMLAYPVTCPFGEVCPVHPQPHTGLDLATPVGTAAQSLTNGIVEKITTNDPMIGASVRVDAGNGREWVYGHLSQVNVTTGQNVSTGDVLGLTGGVPGTPGAGHSSGAHIHLTALQDGIPVDPAQAMQGTSFWDSLKHWMTTPGTELAGIQGPPTAMEQFLGWLGNGLHTLIQIMPEVCVVLAMAFLLIGMVGSKRAMHYAGTSVLLAFVGVILNAVLSI